MIANEYLVSMIHRWSRAICMREQVSTGSGMVNGS